MHHVRIFLVVRFWGSRMRERPSRDSLRCARYQPRWQITVTVGRWSLSIVRVSHPSTIYETIKSSLLHFIKCYCFLPFFLVALIYLFYFLYFFFIFFNFNFWSERGALSFLRYVVTFLWLNSPSKGYKSYINRTIHSLAN